MSSVELHFQGPKSSDQKLLDVISRAAGDAERGGGIFAFASPAGIRALLDDDLFKPLVERGGFELVVGVDSITNPDALNALAEYSARYEELSARVFVHETGMLFHPKLCWFAAANRLTLIVGSGNFTSGGLVSNFEAFVVTSLEGKAATGLEAKIASWLQLWDDCLFQPDQPEAIERAKGNSGSERSLLKPMAPAPEFPDKPVPADDGAAVLVAELSNNRPGQLDVGTTAYHRFFGARPERTHILVQHVDENGTLEAVEPPRLLFSNESENYRFEAAAGTRKPRPAEGRPRRLGVFVRPPDEIFRYRLLWSDDPGYGEIEAYLTAVHGPAPAPRRGPMRRQTATVSEIEGVWPDSPLLAAVRGRL